MEQFVINIGRQLGSGGRTVGEIIARRLGVKLYARIRAASMSSSRPTMPTASAASAAGRDAPRRRPAR